MKRKQPSASSCGACFPTVASNTCWLKGSLEIGLRQIRILGTDVWRQGPLEEGKAAVSGPAWLTAGHAWSPEHEWAAPGSDHIQRRADWRVGRERNTQQAGLWKDGNAFFLDGGRSTIYRGSCWSPSPPASVLPAHLWVTSLGSPVMGSPYHGWPSVEPESRHFLRGAPLPIPTGGTGIGVGGEGWSPCLETLGASSDCSPLLRGRPHRAPVAPSQRTCKVWLSRKEPN